MRRSESGERLLQHQLEPPVSVVQHCDANHFYELTHNEPIYQILINNIH